MTTIEEEVRAIAAGLMEDYAGTLTEFEALQAAIGIQRNQIMDAQRSASTTE